jgi:hypothetical protein
MSPRRKTLSSGPAVAGVLVVLAIVIAINVRTFAPRSAHWRPRQAASAQVSPPLPVDLQDVVRHSGQRTEGLGRGVDGPRPDIARDPFSGNRVATAASVGGFSDPLPRAVAPAPRKSGQPVCTAVMLGARAPAALIDNHLYHVGDQLGGYRVERIDARGVMLAGGGGLFLPVGIASSGAGPNVVVTGTGSGERLGRTSLVEHAESERK